MISVPLMMDDYTMTHLYSTATSNAFAFEGSYVVQESLKNGVGYWLKFNGDQNISLAGLSILTDTITVTQGWNLIGSISTPLAVSNVTSIPEGVVTSYFYGYAGTYFSADTIQPGYGYWVKVNQAGKLVLSETPSAIPSSKIRIVPINEQPPKPPLEEETQRKTEVPTAFALEQNYPNPFNPATVIKYSLPSDEHVKLSIYNMLGQEVATLVNGAQMAGYQSISFNSNNLPSGIYTYRLTAGTFTDIKKMMFLK